jgi:hypothetical protein
LFWVRVLGFRQSDARTPIADYERRRRCWRQRS